MKRFVLCISFIQIGTPPLSTPDVVVRLAKTRVAEQLQKNYSLEAAFDSNRCHKTLNYEVFMEGIRFSSSDKFWTAPLYLSFQELLDGQKINFPLDLEAVGDKATWNLQSTNSLPQNSRTKKIIIWGAAIGLGGVGTYYYLKNRRAVAPPQITQLGFARTF